MSIPLNNIVKIKPGVLGVGNNGNNLFGLMLTKQKVLPTGQTTSFTSADLVGNKFGFDSIEYNLANVYFAGFTNSDRVAAELYIAPYYMGASSASLIGGSLDNVTIDELRDFTVDLSVVIGQKTYPEEGVSLSADLLKDVKSFSDAADKLSSALFGNNDPVASMTYSSANQAMVITVNHQDTLTDNNISISTSGELAEKLYLTVEGGAKVSDSGYVENIASLLNQLRQQNLSFCSVFLSWEASAEEKMQFAQWADSMKDDVCVILNDTDQSVLDASTINVADPDKSKFSFAEKVADKNYEGVVCVYNHFELCAFIAGYPAAWDLTKTDGRFTAAFRRSSLLTPNVSKESDAQTLKAKGYNFYGSWASATSNFTFMYEGKISGQYLWLDSWYCQVWMRRQFQYYFVLTLLAKGQIPYNSDGKGILTTAIKPAIDQFLNFGAIRPGISLSDTQVQSLKQAGLNLSQINNITSIGYYLKVDMNSVTPQTRVQRGSPPINFWYTDGQSIQQINMNSIEIQ